MAIHRHLISTSYGQVHCREALAPGSGRDSRPAVIVFHINQQSSALHIELLEALAPSIHAVAMDYPGCGMSDHIGFQPTIADYARCGAEVMAALDIAHYGAMGEATGATVAMELARRHADRVHGVVLLNCPMYKDRGQAEEVHRPLKTDLRPSDESGFPLTRTLAFMRDKDPTHAPLHPDQSWMDRINVAQVETGRDRWQALDALNAYDIKAGLEGIGCETLLLMGEHFHYTSQLQEYVRRIKRLAAAEVVAGARFCMAWEKADLVAARASQFLTRTAAALTS